MAKNNPQKQRRQRAKQLKHIQKVVRKNKGKAGCKI